MGISNAKQFLTRQSAEGVSERSKSMPSLGRIQQSNVDVVLAHNARA